MTDEFKHELIGNPASFICSKWVLDRIPFVFNEDMISYIHWKEEFSSRIKVDSKAMVFTGSASCGFSLSPYKTYKEFSEESDIDIAIVSGFYFDIAWKTLRNLGTKRFDLTPKQKSSLEDHVNRLIYWGTIATDKLLEILPFGKSWTLHLLEMSKIEPINGRIINIRLYKDHDALRAYHVNNLEKLRIELYENK